MKKSNRKELKFYEKIGIKKFKKLAFKTREIINYPFTYKLSKEKRHNLFYKTPDNYVMKKGNGTQDLKDFKKELLTNTIIHTIGIAILSPFLINSIALGNVVGIIENICFLGINIYCIMLQRYNHIRINNVLEKMQIREDKIKTHLKEDILEEKDIEKDYNLTLVDFKGKEKNTSIDELLNNSSYKELKVYKEKLTMIKKEIDNGTDLSAYAFYNGNDKVLSLEKRTTKIK